MVNKQWIVNRYSPVTTLQLEYHSSLTKVIYCKKEALMNHNRRIIVYCFRHNCISNNTHLAHNKNFGTAPNMHLYWNNRDWTNDPGCKHVVWNPLNITTRHIFVGNWILYERCIVSVCRYNLQHTLLVWFTKYVHIEQVIKKIAVTDCSRTIIFWFKIKVHRKEWLLSTKHST